MTQCHAGGTDQHLLPIQQTSIIKSVCKFYPVYFITVHQCSVLEHRPVMCCIEQHHTQTTVAFQEDQSFQQTVGHACSILTHEQSTLKQNMVVVCRLQPVFPSYIIHGPYHCTTSLLWQKDWTKDLKFKTRTKDCNFVLKDNQGPRTTSLSAGAFSLMQFAL